MNLFFKRFIIFAVALFGFESCAFCAGASLVVDSDKAEELSARRAIEMGLPTLAESISQKLLTSEFLQNREQIALILADSLIAQGKFTKAGAVLGGLKNLEESRLNLRQAIVFLGEKSNDKAVQILSKIDENTLPQDEKSWFFIAKGIVEFDAANLDLAKIFFKRAEGASVSNYVFLESQILSNLCSLINNVPSKDSMEAMLPELELNSSVFAGTHEGVEFTKLLAYVYSKINRTGEALSIITDAINLGLISDSDKDSLELLYALLEPSVSGKIQVLKTILENTKSPEIAGSAIYLLRNATYGNSQDFNSILTKSLEKGSSLIGDRILLELAYFSFQKSDFKALDLYAQRLLKDYPASQFRADLYSILAWSQFVKKVPNYKLAAKYMLEIAAISESAKLADFAKFLAADCYFLDGDFDSSCAMYMPLINSSLDEKWKGDAFARAVESALNLDRISEAVSFADTTYKVKSIDPDDIWRAEWLIYLSYRNSENFDAAFARVSRLLADYKNGAFNHDLLAKLYLLQAKISENAQKYSQTLDLVENLLQQFKLGTLKASAQTSDEVASSAMLIRARTLAELNRLEGAGGAFEAFENLRKAYPISDSAQLSYLLQARIYARKNAFAQAQSLCKTLADNFSDGLYADIALFEAANYSRKLGLKNDYRQAVRLLSDLISKYPNSPRLFYAKISQAEILRLMGDFATASVLYQDIISEYPNHSDILLAFAGLGDTYLALPNKSNEAAAIFERIYAMPDTPLDLKAESAFKWGFAINDAGRTNEAAEVWWMCINSLLNFSNSKTLAEIARSDFSPKQKYWYSRILLQLAMTLENLGDTKSALSAYELLVKYELPGYEGVKSKILNTDLR